MKRARYGLSASKNFEPVLLDYKCQIRENARNLSKPVKISAIKHNAISSQFEEINIYFARRQRYKALVTIFIFLIKKMKIVFCFVVSSELGTVEKLGV